MSHGSGVAGEGAAMRGLGRPIGRPLRGDAALPGLRRLRLLEVGGTEDRLAGHLGLHDAAEVLEPRPRPGDLDDLVVVVHVPRVVDRRPFPARGWGLRSITLKDSERLGALSGNRWRVS